MHVDLGDELKNKLKEAIGSVHEAEGITPEMIRGYGGKRVDRYNTAFPETEFDLAMTKLAKVTAKLKAEMLRKAAEK